MEHFLFDFLESFVFFICFHLLWFCFCLFLTSTVLVLVFLCSRAYPCFSSFFNTCPPLSFWRHLSSNPSHSCSPVLLAFLVVVASVLYLFIMSKHFLRMSLSSNPSHSYISLSMFYSVSTRFPLPCTFPSSSSYCVFLLTRLFRPKLRGVVLASFSSPFGIPAPLMAAFFISCCNSLSAFSANMMSLGVTSVRCSRLAKRTANLSISPTTYSKMAVM